MLMSQEVPKLRLDGNFRRLEYTARVSLTPGEDRFRGEIEITVESGKPACTIWLNAAPEGILGQAPDPVDGGRRPQVQRRIFKLKDGGDWYVYTQFQAIADRRAFPRFDELSYKCRGTSRSKCRGTSRPSPTPRSSLRPLPVIRRRPVRIIVLKGRTVEAEFAAPGYRGSSRRNRRISSAFHTPLFEGAMENAGLFTYNSPMILSNLSEDSIQRQRLYTRVAVHKIGLQWFGNS